MKGHIRRRGKNSFELKFDAGRDLATGYRRTQYVSFRGTKRQAQVKLAELIASVSGGSYVEPSKITVAEFIRTRVDQWEAAGDISARTAQRYRQLVDNQMIGERTGPIRFVEHLEGDGRLGLMHVVCRDMGRSNR